MRRFPGAIRVGGFGNDQCFYPVINSIVDWTAGGIGTVEGGRSGSLGHV